MKRDWSLITGRGVGLQNGGGGEHVKFYPTKGGGGGRPETVLAMGGGGHKKIWGSFYAVA